MTTINPNLLIHRAEDRGTTNLGWLRSRHSFSFGQFRDPQRMNFRDLRVINDDIVAPGGGFGEHGHNNMEIISWVLEGALEHRDSTGTHGVIKPNDVQVMTAGSGIRHSEMNASHTESVHFLQIWIEPAKRDLEPAYSQKSFAPEERRGRWQVFASPDERDDSLKIHQDAIISGADIAAGDTIAISLEANRHAYLHVVSGQVRFGEDTFKSGDGVSFSGRNTMQLHAEKDSSLLFFNLA